MGGRTGGAARASPGPREGAAGCKVLEGKGAKDRVMAHNYNKSLGIWKL